MNKRKTVYVYINGERMWDVLQLALEHNIFLDDMKERIFIENRDSTVEFRVERIDEDFSPPAYAPFVCGYLPLDGRGYLQAFQVGSDTICWTIAGFSERCITVTSTSIVSVETTSRITPNTSYIPNH